MDAGRPRAARGAPSSGAAFAAAWPAPAAGGAAAAPGAAPPRLGSTAAGGAAGPAAGLRAGGAVLGLALCSGLARSPRRRKRARRPAAGALPALAGTALGPRRARGSRRGLPSPTARRVFDRFREDAITAIYSAQEEAIRQKRQAVCTEYVLLGVVAEDQKGSGNKVATGALARVGVSPELLKNAVGDVARARGAAVFTPQGGSALPFSDNAKVLFDVANANCPQDKDVGTAELLMAMTRPELSRSGAAQVLEDLGVGADKLADAIKAESSDAGKQLALAGGAGGDDKKKLTLDEVATNLTQLALEGALDPVVGREEELERVVQILLRRRKNNACLVGPPGVGKTAVAEGFAQLVASGKVPARLRGKQVYSLDLGLLVSGTKYRGEFEERLKSVISEVTSAERDVCLFIDEIHQLVGAGMAGGESAMDAANLLKPALARGELQVIGATTLDEYVKYIEKDGALERRFQRVACEEPTVQQTIKVLEGLRSSYEAHHGVLVMPEALAAAARLSHRYLPDRYLPDKAIDLVDEAGSAVQLRAGDSDPDQLDAAAKPVVTASDVASVLSRWCGVPVDRLTQDQQGQLMHLEETLGQSIVGQRAAVNAIARAVRRARAGMSGPNRPVASLYFAGPTGVGKSELCKVLASEYYADPQALVQIDMSEYSEKHSVSRLVGPPPGYVGFEDPRSGQLTEAVRRRPYSVVVLDEIEKAHGEVLNLMLQVLEDGRLTDGKGRTVNFSNCIVIMTSNVGSREILSASEGSYASLRAVVQGQLQRQFRPEFLNRLDELIIFRALAQEDLRQIARLALRDAAARASAAQQEARALAASDAAATADRAADHEVLRFEWTVALEDEIIERGSDVVYGARPLRRAVQRCFEDPLAELLVSGLLSGGCDGGVALVDVDNDGILVRHGGAVVRPQLAAADEASGGVEQARKRADLEARYSSTEAEVAPAVAVS